MRNWTRTVGLIILVLPCQAVFGCSRMGPFSFDELFVADVIVRATAAEYKKPPIGEWWTTGIAESTITFDVEEVLTGKLESDSLVLNGYLNDKDDFNDIPVPYKFVRRNGRSGSCFANTYRKGGQFLLFLKGDGKGWTPNISALGPSNEQLRGTDDPWLEWVRSELARRGKASDGNKITHRSEASPKEIS